MSPGATFERVYLAVKEQLRQGLFAPAEHLDPARLADQLASSVTPVRDALHRLAGERLVDTPQHNGFRVPLITEAGLRHLYAWHADLMLLALARRRSPGRATAGPFLPADWQRPSDVTTATRLMFATVAERAGTEEQVVALANADDRLHPFRLAETRVLGDLEGELDMLAELLKRAELAPLRKGIGRYRLRRQRLAPQLVEIRHYVISAPSRSRDAPT